jgi:hypothetical protein
VENTVIDEGISMLKNVKLRSDGESKEKTSQIHAKQKPPYEALECNGSFQREILFPFRPLGKTVELLIHREYNTCEVLLKEYTRTVENYIWACDFGRKNAFPRRFCFKTERIKLNVIQKRVVKQ